MSPPESAYWSSSIKTRDPSWNAAIAIEARGEWITTYRNYRTAAADALIVAHEVVHDLGASILRGATRASRSPDPSPLLTKASLAHPLNATADSILAKLDRLTHESAGQDTRIGWQNYPVPSSYPGALSSWPMQRSGPI